MRGIVKTTDPPMQVQGLPMPSRFIFWCTAPLLVANIALLPFVARPSGAFGWVGLGAFALFCLFVLMGLWDAERFWWSWRAVGGLVAGGCVAYLIAMIAKGQWFGNTSILSASAALLAFGYPGIMWAVFGRFTWNPQPEHDD